MKKMKWPVMAAVAAALVLSCFPAFAREGEEATGPVPWVSKIDGADDATLVKQEDTDWFEAVENTPISEGDMIWQDKGGRSEVYIDRYSYIRLDEESAVQFDKLADNEVRMVLTQGRAEVSNGSNRPLLVDIPGQTVVLPPHTKARVTVTPEGATEVAVRKGEATVESDERTVKVKKGQKLRTGSDGTIDRLQKDESKDNFDKWSDKRDAKLGTFTAPPTVEAAELPPPVAYEMSQGGAWMNTPEYGWVWSPQVAPDWAPYREGRWVYRPAWGWTWVSYEPWGWYPYHYGRWVVVGGHWAWSPVYVVHHRWHPGLVFWVEGPDYIAWQPIPWGVSVAVVRTWGPGYIDYYVVPSYITVVHHSHFSHCYYGRYVRPWPGHCGSGCHIGHYPSHYGPRYSHVTHSRTPRPQGYVSHSRAPRDNVVYAHHRGYDGRSQSQRVSYGASSRPGRIQGVNSADTQRGRAAYTNSNGRPNPAGRDANTRPAPGNRANPGPANQRDYGSRTGARNDSPSNLDRQNPGTARDAGSNNYSRKNPSARSGDQNRQNPGAAPKQDRPARASSSGNRPAAGNREQPGAASSHQYGSSRAGGSHSSSSGLDQRPGGSSYTNGNTGGRSNGDSSGGRPTGANSGGRGNNQNSSANSAPSSGYSNQSRPANQGRSGNHNRNNRDSDNNSANSSSYTGSSSSGSYSAPSSGPSNSSSSRPGGSGYSSRPSGGGSSSGHSSSGSSSGRSSSSSRGGSSHRR